MNISEYDKLPLREKDALVAEKVIGFTVYRYEMEDGTQYSVLGMQPAIPGVTHEKPVRVNLKEYTKDLNACHEIMHESPSNKLRELPDYPTVYFEALSKVGADLLWYKIHATAEQRCKAALIALGFLKA